LKNIDEAMLAQDRGGGLKLLWGVFCFVKGKLLLVL
jgi:hypothetical protein